MAWKSVISYTNISECFRMFKGSKETNKCSCICSDGYDDVTNFEVRRFKQNTT